MQEKIIPLLESCKILSRENHFNTKTSINIRQFLTILQNCKEKVNFHIRNSRISFGRAGYVEMWQNDKSVESEGRLENLKELVSAVEEFESLNNFLEHIQLVMDNSINKTKTL